MNLSVQEKIHLNLRKMNVRAFIGHLCNILMFLIGTTVVLAFLFTLVINIKAVQVWLVLRGINVGEIKEFLNGGFSSGSKYSWHNEAGLISLIYQNLKNMSLNSNEM